MNFVRVSLFCLFCSCQADYLLPRTLPVAALPLHLIPPEWRRLPPSLFLQLVRHRKELGQMPPLLGEQLPADETEERLWDADQIDRFERGLESLQTIAQEAITQPETISARAIATSKGESLHWLYPVGVVLTGLMGLLPGPTEESDYVRRPQVAPDCSHRTIAYLMAVGRFRAIEDTLYEILTLNSRTRHQQLQSHTWLMAEFKVSYCTRAISEVLWEITWGSSTPSIASIIDATPETDFDALTNLLEQVIHPSGSLFNELYDALPEAIKEGDPALDLASTQLELYWIIDPESELSTWEALCRWHGPVAPSARVDRLVELLDRARIHLKLEALRLGLMSTELKLRRLRREANRLRTPARLEKLTKLQAQLEADDIASIGQLRQRINAAPSWLLASSSYDEEVGRIRRACLLARSVLGSFTLTMLRLVRIECKRGPPAEGVLAALQRFHDSVVGIITDLASILKIAISHLIGTPLNRFLLRLLADNHCNLFLTSAKMLLEALLGTGLVTATPYEWQSFPLFQLLARRVDVRSSPQKSPKCAKEEPAFDSTVSKDQTCQDHLDKRSAEQSYYEAPLTPQLADEDD